MLTRKPKRTELLRLFLGQPPAMTVLMLIVTIVLSFGTGLIRSIWNLFHAGGWASFVPTTDVLTAAVLFGVAMGVFNITGDSAEMDTVLERRSPSMATYLLLDLSLCFAEGAMYLLVRDTYLTQFVGALELSMLATLLVAIPAVRVLQKHFKSCLHDIDSLQRHSTSKN